MVQPEDMIDHIVAGVLEQLRAPGSAAAGPLESTTSSVTDCPTANTRVEINEDVVTAALLEERGIISGPIVLGANSVLTPSARDFLAARRVDWTRAKSAPRAAERARAKWLAIITRSTTSLVAASEWVAKESAIQWKHELAGCHKEAAERAVGAICRGECDGAVVLTGKPESVACRANRNPKVRGAAVATIARIKAVRGHLAPNLFAVDPGEKSAFELRNLLREICLGDGGGAKPVIPPDWNE